MMRVLLLFVALSGLALLSTMIYALDDFTGPGPLAEEKTIRFKKGTGFTQMVDRMGEEGVIRHPLFFKIIAVTLGDARTFKAGEYKFTPAISPSLVMNMIAQGKVVVHKITVAEGLTVAEVRALLEKEDALEGPFPADIAEGTLLPETYHFVYSDSRIEIVSRMKKAMQTTLDELWEKRRTDTPITTKEQALILASIVEKETGIASERPLVASVFINRLRKGMPLQTDPTVIYAITKGEAPLGRPLLRKDITDTDSPYNTYKYPGLPPGPIANPGRDAIAAALNPPDSPYYYFVATGTGGHNFSATLDGHNANVAEYRRVLKEAK